MTATAPDWSDIGRQLEELGSSVASYVKATMDDPETKRHAAKVREQLDTAAKAVGDAMAEARRSEAGQIAYNAASSAASAAVVTGQKVAEEMRPHLADALRKANEAVRAAAESMTSRGDGTAAPPTAGVSAEEPPASTGTGTGTGMGTGTGTE